MSGCRSFPANKAPLGYWFKQSSLEIISGGGVVWHTILGIQSTNGGGFLFLT
jgi:hypothetical protein